MDTIYPQIIFNDGEEIIDKNIPDINSKFFLLQLSDIFIKNLISFDAYDGSGSMLIFLTKKLEGIKPSCYKTSHDLFRGKELI